MVIHPGKRYFIDEEGKPVFLLADTVWSAFTNTTEADWEAYLDYRKRQGFNALQINLLPQWDRSMPDLGYRPFETDADGKYDFYRINEDYFDRAERMIRLAKEHGMTAMLVLLWCNYTPDSWASRRMQGQDVMKPEEVQNYVRYAVNKLRSYNPVFIISGDAKYESTGEIGLYLLALHTVKSAAPELLTTLHPAGRFSDIPKDLLESEELDFYLFQSGHSVASIDCASELTSAFMALPKRPCMNGEPCYEAHYNRASLQMRHAFTAKDTRRALWQSVLGGACAGVTYGAQGLWSGHDRGRSFNSTSGEGYYWDDALRLEGAWDYSMARQLIEQYRLFDMEILGDLGTIGAACGKKEHLFAVYLPNNGSVLVPVDGRYSVRAYVLEQRRIAVPDTEYIEDGLLIHALGMNSDVLIIGQSKEAGISS